MVRSLDRGGPVFANVAWGLSFELCKWKDRRAVGKFVASDLQESNERRTYPRAGPVGH